MTLVADDDLDEALLELGAELFEFVAPTCANPHCAAPRGTGPRGGRRRFCDEHAGERVQESKNRWWRRNGTDWRNGAAA